MFSGTWWWGTQAKNPVSPTDAAHDPALRAHFTTFLESCEPPNTFRASEVAQNLSPAELKNLGYEKWEEALEGVKELAWELRELGDCEIIKKGRLVPEDVSAYEVEGSVRIRRKAEMEFRDSSVRDGESWIS